MMNDESRKRAHILHYSLFILHYLIVLHYSLFILHYPLFFILHYSLFIYKGKVTTPVSAHVDI